VCDDNPLSRYIVVPALFDQSVDANTSEAVEAGGRELIGVVIPSDWDGGNLTFYGSVDGAATYQLITKEEGTSVLVTVTASRAQMLSQTLPHIAGFEKIKLEASGTVAADRTVKCIFRDR